MTSSTNQNPMDNPDQMLVDYSSTSQLNANLDQKYVDIYTT